MDAYKALELVEQLEMNLGEMYAKLRTKFSGDKELEALFYQLHLNELSHVSLARMKKRIIKARLGGFEEVHLNITDFNKVMHMMTVVLAMPRDDSNEVLLQCFLIESSLVEQYVVAALKDSNLVVRQLLEMLSRGFRDHLAILAVRIKDLGGDLTYRDSVRLSPRVSFSGRVLVNDKVNAQSVDISESGMFLLTSQTFPEGTRITLSFPIGNGVVVVKAVVRYLVPNAGIGLLFDELSNEHRALIKAYVGEALQEISNESHRKTKEFNGDRSGMA